MPSPTSLAPGYVRVTYSGELFPHHMVVPVNYDGVPTPGSEPDILLKDASSSGVIAAFSDMFDLIIPFYSTSVVFGLAEAHTVDPDTGADAFIFSWNINKSGTVGLASNPTAQDVFIFKLSNGFLYKLYLMEDVNPANLKQLPTYPDPTSVALSDFITGNSSPVYGRHNAYPFTPVSRVTKFNDKLRQQQGLA